MLKKIVIALGMIVLATSAQVQQDYNAVYNSALAYGDAKSIIGKAFTNNNAQGNANLQNNDIRNAILAANKQAANQWNGIR